MNRREFLGVGGSIATAAIAGCSSSDSSAESATTPTTTTVSEETTEHLDNAINYVEDAADEFESQSRKFDSSNTYVDFETGKIVDLLDQADKELNKAEPNATTEQAEAIASLRTLIEWLRGASNVLDAFGDGLDEMQASVQYFENDRFEDAESRADTALTNFESADEELTILQDSLEEDESLNSIEITEVDINEFKRAIDDLDEALDGLTYFGRGYRSLSRGFDPFTEAADLFDNEQYEDAVPMFERARDQFAAANSTFREGEDVAPQMMLSDFVELTCLSGAFRDGADHFATAAEAGSNQNWDKARDARSDAESALEQCD